MRGLFVTGTDTGVGKTIVTAALVSALRAEGVDVGIVKPVESGHPAGDPDGDTATLIRLAGLDDRPETVNLYALAAPLAPLVAARIQNKTIFPDRIVEFVRNAAKAHESVLVEGAGGFFVPLAEGWMVADLAAELGLPVLVVARPGLGTVNHSVLTVRAVRAAGLEPAGVILNGRSASTDASASTNAGLIEEFAQTRVLGSIPWLDRPLTPERLRGMINDHIDLGTLRRYLAGTAPVPAGGGGS